MGLQGVESSADSSVFCLTCYNRLSNRHELINYRIHHQLSIMNPNPIIHHTKPASNKINNEKRLVKYDNKINSILVRKVYCQCCSALIGFKIEKSFKVNFKIATLTGRIYFNVDRVIIDFKHSRNNFNKPSCTIQQLET